MLLTLTCWPGHSCDHIVNAKEEGSTKWVLILAKTGGSRIQVQLYSPPVIRSNVFHHEASQCHLLLAMTMPSKEVSRCAEESRWKSNWHRGVKVQERVKVQEGSQGVQVQEGAYKKVQGTKWQSRCSDNVVCRWFFSSWCFFVSFSAQVGICLKSS